MLRVKYVRSHALHKWNLLFYVQFILLQELEPKIQAAGNGVLAKLHENDKKIEALLARIELDEVSNTLVRLV